MMELVVQIARTNGSNLGVEQLGRTLKAWEELQHYNDEVSFPALIERAPDLWYHIAVDTSEMIEHLREAIRRNEETLPAFLEFVRTRVAPIPRTLNTPEPREPTIRLMITPHGSGGADEPPLDLVERFLQQLFLAMNIATPASFNLEVLEYPNYTTAVPRGRPLLLSADHLDDAYYHALEEGWPALITIPFRQTWDWLHREMAYDIEVATEPAHKAFFAILRICTRAQGDPDNTLLLSQAFESLLTPTRGRLQRTVRERLELVIGSSSTEANWFDRFYKLRSRTIHGSAPVLRPGRLGFNPEANRLQEEAYDLEVKAVGALLALLQDMVVHNTRAYRFERNLVRETWQPR